VILNIPSIVFLPINNDKIVLVQGKIKVLSGLDLNNFAEKDI
jgi:hypothetical protein